MVQLTIFPVLVASQMRVYTGCPVEVYVTLHAVLSAQPWCLICISLWRHYQIQLLQLSTWVATTALFNHFEPSQTTLACDVVLRYLGVQGSWPCVGRLSRSLKWILLIGLSFVLMLWAKCNHMSDVKNLPNAGGHKLLLQLVWLSLFL